MSGRLSFELVQKAAVAGVSVVVASARRRALQSGLRAVAASRSAASCVAGTANVYTEPWRIDSLTGILLAGGTARASARQRSLREFERRALGDRAWRLLGEACDERIRVGPGGLDDPGTGPVAAIAAGLRAASHEIAVVIPVDMPRLTAAALRELAVACRDAAVAQNGPLPCAIRRAAFPKTDERRLRTVLAGLDTVSIRLPEEVLANVNDRDDLQRLG